MDNLLNNKKAAPKLKAAIELINWRPPDRLTPPCLQTHFHSALEPRWFRSYAKSQSHFTAFKNVTTIDAR